MIGFTISNNINDRRELVIFVLLTITSFLHSCSNEDRIGVIKVSDEIQMNIYYDFENFDRKYSLFYTIEEGNKKVSPSVYFYSVYDNMDVDIDDFETKQIERLIFLSTRWDNNLVSVYDLESKRDLLKAGTNENFTDVRKRKDSLIEILK